VAGDRWDNQQRDWVTAIEQIASRPLLADLGLIVDGPSSTRCCVSRSAERTFAGFADRIDSGHSIVCQI
jgi:hypothetical protein